MKLSVFAKELQRIQGETGDYLSHEAALYAHGLTLDFPDRVVMVSSGRRRSRIIDGISVDFVFHKPERVRQTCLIKVCDTELLVATPYQALVDILNDNTALTLRRLAEIFWVTKFDAAELVGLAAKCGNSVLKRTLFWCLWSGRIGLEEIEVKLPRNPVYLIPGKISKKHWEGSIQVFYPPELLRLVIDLPHADPDVADSEWARLRQNSNFGQFAFESGRLLLKDDKRPSAKKFLASFFKSEFERLLKEDLEQLLAGIDQNCRQNDRTNLPQAFWQWVKQNTDFPLSFKKQVRKWVKKALEEEDPTKWQIALVYAPFTGLVDEAFSRLKNSSKIFFNSGYYLGLEQLCQRASEDGIAVPGEVSLLLSRVFVVEQRFSEALAILERLATEFKAESRLGIDVEFARGVTFRQMGKPTLALKCFENARKIAGEISDKTKLAAIYSAIGNIYFNLPDLTRARKNYLDAYAHGKGSGNHFLIANLKTNLGLVEFRSGNLKKADRYFLQALEQQKKTNNLLGELISLISLGKVRLARGKISAAVKLFQKACNSLPKDRFVIEERELMALLAWSFELAGCPDKADNYWDKIESDNTRPILPASEFLIRLLKSLWLVLRANFTDAAVNLDALIEFSEIHKISDDDVALAKFYLALARFLSYPKTDKDCFVQALKALQNRPGQPISIMAQIVATLLFPENFGNDELDANLRRLIETEYFEPLWVFFAPQLLASRFEAAKALAYSFWKKGNMEFFRMIANRFPEFRKVFKRLCERYAEPEEVTLLKNGRESAMQKEEYQIWQNGAERNHFKFDSLSGRISFSHVETFMKNDSITARALLCLLRNYPEPVSIESLYSKVWNEKYDSECDWPAVKTALSRLRKALTRVCPLVEIKSHGRNGALSISLPSLWSTVF